MNAESTVKLSLKVLSIYIIGVGLSQIPEYVAFMDGALPGVQFSADVNFYLSLVFSPLIVGIALWFAAPPAARFIAKGVVQEETSDSHVQSLQAVAFATLGMYFVVENLPQLISSIIRLISGQDTQALTHAGRTFVSYNQLEVVALRVILGVILVVGAQFFTQLLRRLREYGLRPTNSTK